MSAIDSVGQGEGLAEGAVIVIAQPGGGGDDQGQRQSGEANKRGGRRAILAKESPAAKHKGDGQAKQQSFIGASDHQKHDADGHQKP